MKSRQLGAKLVALFVLAHPVFDLYNQAQASTLFQATNIGIFQVDPITGIGPQLSPINASDISYGDGYLYSTTGVQIDRFDPITGAPAFISDHNANAITYGDGLLYANLSGQSGIVTIDLLTGDASPVNGLANVTSLVFGGGFLFAATNNGIFKVDPTIGLGSTLSPINAIDLSYGDGYLYTTTGVQIDRFDPFTGAALSISDHNADAIAYGDGLLFAYLPGQSATVTIDLLTGEASPVNSRGNVNSLAFQSVIPLPPALYLFGSGLIGLIGMARRKVWQC